MFVQVYRYTAIKKKDQLISVYQKILYNVYTGTNGKQILIPWETLMAALMEAFKKSLPFTSVFDPDPFHYGRSG